MTLEVASQMKVLKHHAEWTEHLNEIFSSVISFLNYFIVM